MLLMHAISFYFVKNGDSNEALQLRLICFIPLQIKRILVNREKEIDKEKERDLMKFVKKDTNCYLFLSVSISAHS